VLALGRSHLIAVLLRMLPLHRCDPAGLELRRSLRLNMLALKRSHLTGVLLLDGLHLGLVPAPHHLHLLGMLLRYLLCLGVMMIFDSLLPLGMLALY
jgi:hypothetical protein